MKMCACAIEKKREYRDGENVRGRRERKKLIKQNSHLITERLTRNVLFKLIAIAKIAIEWCF